MNLYWGSMFCAHFVQYAVALLICIGVILAFRVSPFILKTNYITN